MKEPITVPVVRIMRPTELATIVDVGTANMPAYTVVMLAKDGHNIVQALAIGGGNTPSDARDRALVFASRLIHAITTAKL